MEVDLQAKGTDLHDATVVGDTVGRAQNIESTEKVGKGAILPFFLQITYGHSQLSIIGGECFFVVGGVRAFGGEALAQVVDFVVVLLKKRVDFLCNSFVFSNLEV